jgi:hypothetical protein
LRYQQDLQVSLRDRLRRLLVADCEDAGHETRLVTCWIEQQPTLRALLAEAERAEPGLDPDSLITALREGGGGLGRSFRWPSQTEEGRAVLIWHLMRRIAADDLDGTDGTRIAMTYGRAVSSSGSSNINDIWREFTERILRPLFDHLDERIGAESSILYTLERYVRRVEWFERDDLYRRYEADRQNGEEVYNRDLRKFLFSEGINMPFTQAKSASGLSDILTDLDTEDPFIGEVKLFDAVNHRKRELATGMNQAAAYAQDWKKNTGYLIIINLSGRHLELPSDGPKGTWPPYLDLGGIRVYLIAVRALPTATASKQGKPQPVAVTRDDLINPDA